MDVVVAAYLDLTGQAVPEGTQLDGRRFLAENYDPIAAFRYWRDGELRAGSWLASLRTVNELAWFATDDLRPFGLMCARMAARGITRRFRQGLRLHLRPAGRRVTGRPGARPPRESRCTGRAPRTSRYRQLTTCPGHGRSRARDKGGISMNDVEVAIVGAGPYGLSLASFMRAAGVSFRQFGQLMKPWRTAMPQGMFLKSQGFASSLSNPRGTHTLEAFCAATGRPYASYGLPVPLDTFVAYGEWFQAELLPAWSRRSSPPSAAGTPATTSSWPRARRYPHSQVVVAAGIEHFPSVSPLLAGLPEELCTHSSQHTDLAAWRGRSVIILGAGQSALESAALLHEQGADVRIIMLKPRVAWNGAPLDPDRPLLRRLREPEAGLGSGWGTWFYSNHPGLFRHLPEATRVLPGPDRAWASRAVLAPLPGVGRIPYPHRAEPALGAAQSGWYRARPQRTGR